MTGNGFYMPPIKMVKLVDGLWHCFINIMQKVVYAYIDYIDMYPLVNQHNYGKSPFLMGKIHYFYGHFSIVFCMFTRGYIDAYGYCIRSPVEHKPLERSLLRRFIPEAAISSDARG